MPTVPASLDLTTVVLAMISGCFGILTIVLPLLINSHLKNQAARDVVNLEVKNSLGAMQRATSGFVSALHPSISIPAIDGLPPNTETKLLFGVQHMLDHAGPELKQLGFTNALVASKINAELGLAVIASNIQSAAAPGPTVPVLAPIVAMSALDPPLPAVGNL